MKTNKAILQLTGMDGNSGGMATRDRWARAGGLQHIARALELAGLEGSWVVRLHTQVKANGKTPQMAYRGFDEQNGIELRTRPSGNDTCLELWLRRMGVKTTKEDAKAISDAIDGPSEPDADNGKEVAAAVSHQASNGETTETAKALLSAPPTSKALTECPPNVGELLKTVEAVKDVRRQIAETESDLAKLRVKEQVLLNQVGGNVKLFYDAIEFVEAALAAKGGQS